MVSNAHEVEIPELWWPRLSPTSAALIVVDMQNDFVSPKGKMAALGFDLSDVAGIVAPLKQLLLAARNAGLLIIHTQMLNDRAQNSLAWYAFWGEPVVAIPGSWGADHIPDLAPRPGELVVVKYSYGAFFGTNLDTILRRANIQTVIVTGTGPEICAGDTLRQAFALGYHVAAVADCLASFSKAGREMNQRLKQTALYTIENHYGLVTTSNALIHLWQKYQVSH